MKTSQFRHENQTLFQFFDRSRKLVTFGCMKMEASNQSTLSETTISDLNDDCLHEVFAVMNSDQLAVVADVCVRFRQISMYFARSKCKELRISDRPTYSDYSKLRNFSEFVEQIYLNSYGKLQSKHLKRLIELLNMRCVDTCTEVTFRSVHLTREIAVLLQPLLGRAQKLRFNSCHLDEPILKSLPRWSPELSALECFLCNSNKDKRNRLDSLRQRFDKLTSISLFAENNVTMWDAAAFLKLNPQLKQMELKYCGKLDDSIFALIAKHVPKIEGIHFFSKKRNNRHNIECLGHLSELKLLSLRIHDDQAYMQSVVTKIASSNVALEFLDLSNFDLRYRAAQFTEGISTMQNLTTLRLSDVLNLSAAHLITISENTKGLSNIFLTATNFMMSNDELLTFVRNAKKLQKFEWSVCNYYPATITNIDVNAFTKLVEIADQRIGKTNLNLILPGIVFTLSVPTEQMRAARNLDIRLLL